MTRRKLKFLSDPDRFIAALVRYQEFAYGEQTTLMEKIQEAHRTLNRPIPFVHGGKSDSFKSIQSWDAELSRIRGKKNGQKGRTTARERAKKIELGHMKIIRRMSVSERRWINTMAKLYFILQHHQNVFKRARALRILNGNGWGITHLDPLITSIEKKLSPSFIDGPGIILSPYTDKPSLKQMDKISDVLFSELFEGVKFSET